MARLDTNLKIGDRKSLEPDHELAVESCHTLAGSRNCHVRDVFSSCINVRPGSVRRLLRLSTVTHKVTQDQKVDSGNFQVPHKSILLTSSVLCNIIKRLIHTSGCHTSVTSRDLQARAITSLLL